MWSNLKVLDESPHFPKLESGNSESKLSLSSKSLDRSQISSIDDQYAVMVSCRCNYTGKLFSPVICSVVLTNTKVLINFSLGFVLNKASKLFFKQPTSWRPHTSRDIMISVASDMSGESPGPYERNSQLPVQVNIWFTIDYIESGSCKRAHILFALIIFVLILQKSSYFVLLRQVLTLQASNLTSEDLTLTVLAPASFTSPPSVVSLNSPTTPMSPFLGFREFLGRINGERHIGTTQGRSFNSLLKENDKQSDDVRPQTVSTNDDLIPSSGLSCTHLWLQSRVPLG